VTPEEAEAICERLGIREQIRDHARSLPPLTDAQRTRLRAICDDTEDTGTRKGRPDYRDDPTTDHPTHIADRENENTAVASGGHEGKP